MTADIRVALAGCGHWGRNLARVYAEMGALAAVCDANPVARDALAAEHMVRAAEWDDVLADDDIPAVVIAAPAALHATLVAQALACGKHVFVEKPLALDVAEAAALCAQAEAAGRTLMVGHLLQYHPVFVELRELVANGALGRLEYVYSNRLNLGRFRSEESILWSFAPHDVSMILSLFGSGPSDVDAVGTFCLHRSIADITTTSLGFPSGQRAHIFVSWLHPFKEQKLVVVGTDGMAVFDDGAPWESKLALYPHRVAWKDAAPVPVPATAQPITVKPREPLREECLHFLDSVRSGATPRTDGREGLRVLRVLDAAERALRRRADTGPGPLGPGAPASWRGARVHPSAYVDAGASIGPGTTVWHFSHVLPGGRIGRDCTIGQNVMVGPDVVVGDRCKIQNNVSLYQGVTLEEDVFCGPSCVFTNVRTPRAHVERKDEFAATHVGRGATIGANATVVCGVTIGSYSLVGAGAVVTRDVPPHALVAGVPARQVGWVSHAGERLGSDLVCPRSGRRYQESAGALIEMVGP